VRATHKQGVRGISTRKVYPYCRLPGSIVRSYRTFSPLPRPKGVAVIFCDTFYVFLPKPGEKLRPLGGAALCVVRTFLPASDGSSNVVGFWGKNDLIKMYIRPKTEYTLKRRSKSKGGRAVCSSFVEFWGRLFLGVNFV